MPSHFPAVISASVFSPWRRAASSSSAEAPRTRRRTPTSLQERPERRQTTPTSPTWTRSTTCLKTLPLSSRWKEDVASTYAALEEPRAYHFEYHVTLMILLASRRQLK